MTMENYKIIRIRERKELLETAAEWFHQKWKIPKAAYVESMMACIKGDSPVPQWYVVLDGEQIVGGLGVIENDFHVRKDLMPNVCAVYVEKAYRNQGIAGKMLHFVCEEMSSLGIDTLYLTTDHTSFYERYGWEFYCMVQEEGGEFARMYRHVMEYWDIYDGFRNKTGLKMERGPVAEGDYHLVVCICVFNSEGKLLIQQRQPFKIGWPNMWDISVAGSALAGESSAEAATRELYEELGIRHDFKGVRPHLSVNFDRGFDDIYLVVKDVDLADLKLQPEEVQDAKWATEEEVLRMMEEGTFIPYHPGLIQTYFAMRKGYGTHR